MAGTKELKIGIAFPAFKTSFAHFLPNIETVGKNNPFDYDLIIFSGGEDISPRLYRQPETYASGVSTERDNIEVNILKQILNRPSGLSSGKLYLLGVCRGHQLINAVTGGGLIQDIFMEYKKSHPGTHGLNFKDPSLPTTINSASEMILNFFDEKTGEYEVNSLHHQGVVYAGHGLIATSLFGGVVESAESERIITVQWHPEFMDSYKFFEWLLNKIIDKKALYNKTKKEEEKDSSVKKKLSSDYIDLSRWTVRTGDSTTTTSPIREYYYNPPEPYFIENREEDIEIENNDDEEREEEDDN